MHPFERGDSILYSVAVLEPVSGKVTALVRDWLVRREDASSVVLTRGDCLGAFCGAYDLFVVAFPDGTAIEDDSAAEVSCRVLLTSAEALRIPSEWVVDYGLSVRDSLTISSLEPDLAVLALQRELVPLDGAVIEQQELPLPIPPGTSAQAVMAFYGSLLILGVQPEELV